jgi:acyl-CoA thioesterase
MSPSRDADLSVSDLLDLLDVTLQADGDANAATAIGPVRQRAIVEGTQVIGQCLVAAAKRFPAKSIRSAQAVFARPVSAGEPIALEIDVISDGRTAGTVVVTASQHGRRCTVVTILADTPCPDLIRHQKPSPSARPPTRSHLCPMPMRGRHVRLVDIHDAFSPDETGPPELMAWVKYDVVPDRDELIKALVLNFTGYLGIATSMRPHPGIGMAQAHSTVSTAPVTTSIIFHEPVTCGGWMLYSHESLHAGAGMSSVRGTVHTEDNTLVASFSQEAMIRPMPSHVTAIPEQQRF